MQANGKLLVLEAGDGSGKATQTKMLKERLVAEGRCVRQVEFPDYASPSSAISANVRPKSTPTLHPPSLPSIATLRFR